MQSKSAFITSLCLIIACLAAKSSTISLTSYEIRVSLKQLPLPISISSILRTSKKPTDSNIISNVLIKMGHLTEKHDDYLFPRGISAYIINQTQLSDDFLIQLKSLFQISQDKRFEIYLQQQKMMLISDPNDRPCTQHIQYYLRYFFPCKTFTSLGLQRLISQSKLLEDYLAFEFQWLASRQEVYMKIIFPRQRQRVQSIRQTGCGSISVSEISKDSTLSTSNQFPQNIMYDVSLINRWYNPKKCISHSFKLQKTQINTKIKVINMLPLGFIFDNISFSPSKLNFTYHTTKIGSNLFIISQFLLCNPQDNQVRIQIHFHSSLPPFETFQTIAGGGEEIMNVPLYFEGNRMVQLYSPIISERLLQPDFSIPFQTITFTVGIIGYLWINLWRICKISDDKIKQL